ncbi:unnamed protein product [Durusdinium trenchii]|uniref:Uncharacterized protein n=1 Tax=Durusdinium trenchii TaxID=1381693 RepID=A0ABP0QE68_9DINO
MGPRLPEQLALQPTEVVDLEDDWTGSKLVEVELEDVNNIRIELIDIDAAQPEPPEEELLPSRKSYHSWTAYSPTDPLAQPNRHSHEQFRAYRDMLLHSVQQNPAEFQRLIRKMRQKDAEAREAQEAQEGRTEMSSGSLGSGYLRTSSWLQLARKCAKWTMSG